MRILKLILLLSTLASTGFVYMRGKHYSAFPLAGDLLSIPEPHLSSRTYRNGDFQREYEEYFANKIAFREALIRTENSLNLEIFDEISAPRKSNPVILGKGNFLCEKSYINNVNGVSEKKRDRPYPAPQSIDETARRLGRAAKVFKQLGIHFVMFFYPHKAWAYPEVIDPRWILAGGRERARAGFEELKAALTRHGVPYVDGPAVFERARAADPGTVLFPKGGTHWNYIGACHAVNAMMTVMRPQLGRPLPNIQCTPTGARHPASGREMDIASLVNAWDLKRFDDAVPEVKTTLIGAPPVAPEFFYLQGTSFTGEIYDTLKSTAIGAMESPLPVVYYGTGSAGSIPWDAVVMGKSKMIIFEQSQGSHITVNTMEFVEGLENHSAIFQKQLARLPQGI